MFVVFPYKSLHTFFYHYCLCKNETHNHYANLFYSYIYCSLYLLLFLILLRKNREDFYYISLAYGVLLWVGAPIAFVAVLPLLAGIVKAFTKP